MPDPAPSLAVLRARVVHAETDLCAAAIVYSDALIALEGADEGAKVTSARAAVNATEARVQTAAEVYGGAARAYVTATRERVEEATQPGGKARRSFDLSVCCPQCGCPPSEPHDPTCPGQVPA